MHGLTQQFTRLLERMAPLAFLVDFSLRTEEKIEMRFEKVADIDWLRAVE
jgi:GTPase involved in cell partitioning and DNA repair